MKYGDFGALASRLTAVTPPVEGEEAGEPCRLCGRRARYTQDSQGRWRLVMTHGPHPKAPKPEAGEAAEIRPPVRVHVEERFSWLDE